MSNLRLKDHTWDAANVYDSALGKTQGQINAEVGTSLAGKQGTLVSGENIKTVNGASILGSGNIEIQGGGTGEDGYSPVVTISNITGGHRVNITDKTHQQGQNFDVMDGAKGDTGDPAPASAVVPAVESWLEDNITQETGYVIDDSLTVAGAAADAKKTGDELSDLKSAVGNTTFALDSSILNIKYPVIYASDMSIAFDAPEGGIYNNYVTGIIPLPETLDNQITHNGYGTNNYRAIVFYDDTKTPISSAANSQLGSIVVTPIPDNAAFFRLHYYGEDVHGLQVSFNLSAAEKANYLRTLMHTEPDYYIYDFDAQNIFTLEHTEIDTTTGEASYDVASNYSATDFILLPDDIELLGTYAYTGSGNARVAFYDANKDFISADSSISKRLRATPIPEGAVFVRFGTHSTIPPASCLAIGLIKNTMSNDEIIDMIRQALV